MPYLIEQTF